RLPLHPSPRHSPRTGNRSGERYVSIGVGDEWSVVSGREADRESSVRGHEVYVCSPNEEVQGSRCHGNGGVPSLPSPKKGCRGFPVGGLEARFPNKGVQGAPCRGFGGVPQPFLLPK